MRSKKGFTLIEMMVVLAIIGILIGTLYPSIAKYRERYREQERQKTEYVINKALKQYYALTGTPLACDCESAAVPAQDFYGNNIADGSGNPVSVYFIKNNAAGIDKLKDELKNKVGVIVDTRYRYAYAQVGSSARIDWIILQ